MLPLVCFGHFVVEYIEERNRNCVQLEAFPGGGSVFLVGIGPVGCL